MPADEVDAAAIVDELVRRRHLLRMVAPDGTRVLVVRTFTVHQKIDKRSPGRWGNPEDFSPVDVPPNPPSTDRSQPSPTNPHQSPPIPTTPHPGKGREGKENHVDETSTPRPDPPDVVAVFDAWVASTGKAPGRTRLDAKRKRVISAALKSYPLDDVLDAVDGWRFVAHNRGENDRGTVFNDIDLLLRDAKHIEQFRDAKRAGPALRSVGDVSNLAAGSRF